jgi:hypothetical protein
MEVAGYAADLITVNIDMSGLKSDVQSLYGAVNKSKQR